jgi:hypothetical protein
VKTQVPASAGSNTPFRTLFGIGLLAWLVAQLALVGVGRWARGLDNWLGAADWAIGHGWIAFLTGLAVMLVLSGRLAGGLRPALTAYVLPAGFLAVLAGISYVLFPEKWFLAEMQSFLSLVWVFGVLGWLWLRLQRESAGKDAMIRALLPPLVGGTAVLLCVVVPAFRSNEFRYRDAFGLTLKKTVFADGKLAADAVLEIRKPGDYRFRAVRFSYMDLMEAQEPTSDTSTGRIEWTGAGAPAPGATGSYPLTIRWDKCPAPPFAADEGLNEDCITLEVRTSAEPDTMVHSVSVPLTAKGS